MNKLSIPTISIRNLQRYGVRTWVMVIFTMLLVGMTFTSTILLKSMEQSIDNTINRIGSDIIVVPQEYEDDMKDALFLGEPCSFYFDKSYMHEIQKIDGIKSVSPQLYITSLASDCCASEVQMIAYDPDTDFIIQSWLEEIGLDTLTDQDILIGSSIEGEVGETLKFFNQEFKIAGKLNKTDTSYDEGVFLNFGGAKNLLSDEILSQMSDVKDSDKVISSLMIRTEEGYDIKEIARTVNYSLSGSDIKAYTMNGMFQNISDKMVNLQSFSKIMLSLLIVVSMIALMCIFTITVNERKQEFGVLASLGATKKHIIKIITMEAEIIGFVGGLLGVSISTLGLFLFKNMIFQKLGVLSLYYEPLYILKTGIICVFSGIIVSLISAAYTVISISRTDLINMIKGDV